MKVRSLRDIINEANKRIENDGWLLIAIVGEKGNGKSTLALYLLKQILQVEWKKVLKHVIFTVHDYFNLPYKNLIRDAYGRAKCIVWDDFALHSSVYRFMTSDNKYLSLIHI